MTIDLPIANEEPKSVKITVHYNNIDSPNPVPVPVQIYNGNSTFFNKFQPNTEEGTQNFSFTLDPGTSKTVVIDCLDWIACYASVTLDPVNKDPRALFLITKNQLLGIQLNLNISSGLFLPVYFWELVMQE